MRYTFGIGIPDSLVLKACDFDIVKVFITYKSWTAEIHDDMHQE
jgi:hypothetical protein